MTIYRYVEFGAKNPIQLSQPGGPMGTDWWSPTKLIKEGLTKDAAGAIWRNRHRVIKSAKEGYQNAKDSLEKEIEEKYQMAREVDPNITRKEFEKKAGLRGWSGFKAKQGYKLAHMGAHLVKNDAPTVLISDVKEQTYKKAKRESDAQHRIAMKDRDKILKENIRLREQLAKAQNRG